MTGVDAELRQDITWAIGQIGGMKARITLVALSQVDNDLSVRREASKQIKEGTILRGID